MSTPTHHIPESWLVASAAGTLPEAEAVLVATHVTLCARCRSDLSLAEEIAAGSLRSADPAELDPTGLAAVLARLDDPDPETPTPVDSCLPWPVLKHTGPLEAIDWTWCAPWVRGVALPHTTDGLPLQLITMKAGAHLPHRHAGSEAAVILQGGWQDETGHYERGDAFFAEPSDTLHDQRIDEGLPCVALVLNEQRGQLDGIRGVIARAFFKV